MKFHPRAPLAAVLLAAVLVVTGQGCNSAVKAPPASAKPLTLKYWRVTDTQDAFDEIINDYRALHPNVTIEYRRLRIEEYENELLDALAEDRGPDMLSVHNTWVKNYETKLLPMPSTLKLAFRELRGTIQKQAVWVEKSQPGLSPAQVRSQFVAQVGEDVILPGTVAEAKAGTPELVYGLPLALDTMVLYYNSDALNAAGIPNPAANWLEFQDHVKRITRYDEQGKLQRPAAGIGTAKNVDRSFDILSILMMQNGVVMKDANGLPTFNKVPPSLADRPMPPAEEALIFYTDFANPTKEVFTWDDAQPNSYDAFLSGRTAYFLGYAYHLPLIRSQAPKLNLGIAALPQIDPERNRVNMANYWVESVSRKTAHPNEAWDFIRFATSEARVKSYLAKAKKPTALRNLISSQLNDADLAPFASQVLTAKSWYQGSNVKTAESAFAEMVNSTLRGTEPGRAIRFAVDAITQTIR